MMSKYQLIKFTDNGFELDVRMDLDNETVWLSQEEIAKLFDVDRTRVSRHIANIYKEGELIVDGTRAENAHMGHGGYQKYVSKMYNLDMIISVGYRVKSQRGITFRRWANKIIKEYLIQGYALNSKRLEALNKVIDIQNRMLSYSLNIDKKEVEKVIAEYTKALLLLDDYDKKTLPKISGNKDTYVITYQEICDIIDEMKTKISSTIFGIEKEIGVLKGIVAQIYQNVFDTELYPSLEDKAAHLLYFVVKDHPFIDGCKRIAATIFIHFLYKNNHLYRDNKQIISNEALVAITILAAESNPNDMETIIRLIINLIK